MIVLSFPHPLCRMRRIFNKLLIYEMSSGQKVKFNKTKISFSQGVPMGRKESICHHVRVPEVDIHDRYLGLPTVVGRSKKVITRGVKEKIWKKLQEYGRGWCCLT